jgi:hypothetical protein
MTNHKESIEHLSSDYVWRESAGASIKFAEKQRGGVGEAEFVAANDAIVIKAKDQAPVIWALRVKNCAEGAIITQQGTSYHLHVLEMKSKLTQGEWAKAMLQLEGMFLSAVAVARLAGITDFASATCYIAYVEDAMGPAGSADLIFMKTFVGMDNPIGGVEEWINEVMPLPFGVRAGIRKGQRDADRNVNFGTI